MDNANKAENIVNNFKGATVDSYGCSLLYDQIMKALTAAKEQGFREGVEKAAEVADKFKYDYANSQPNGCGADGKQIAEQIRKLLDK